MELDRTRCLSQWENDLSSVFDQPVSYAKLKQELESLLA